MGITRKIKNERNKLPVSKRVVIDMAGRYSGQSPEKFDSLPHSAWHRRLRRRRVLPGRSSHRIGGYLASRNKKRNEKVRLEDLPISKEGEHYIGELSKTLSRQIEIEIFKKKYAPVSNILKLVGAGVFLASSLAIPNLPLALKPLLANENEYEAWKRFNIPYLKRTLQRLEKQKLVEIEEDKGVQVVKITDAGSRRILKYSLEELAIKKPKIWDGSWRLISYDIPGELKSFREIFRDYLLSWGFYPLHESVFLHAYPCEQEVEFLREYLGVGKYVRIFRVSRIENDQPFKKFFGIEY